MTSVDKLGAAGTSSLDLNFSSGILWHSVSEAYFNTKFIWFGIVSTQKLSHIQTFYHQNK